jgi:hypothetical protein
MVLKGLIGALLNIVFIYFIVDFFGQFWGNLHTIFPLSSFWRVFLGFVPVGVEFNFEPGFGAFFACPVRCFIATAVADERPEVVVGHGIPEHEVDAGQLPKTYYAVAEFPVGCPGFVYIG